MVEDSKGSFMDTFIMILVGFGLAFDVFAIAVSQGSVLGNVKARGIVLMCLMVCAWQILALLIGYGVAIIPDVENRSQEVRMVWEILAGIILIILGGVKLMLIYYRKAMPEVRSDIDFGKTCAIASSTSIYTMFAGFACGLMTFGLLNFSVMICCITVAIVIIGVFVGYRNGELDKRIYWSGGILLIASGVITIVNSVKTMIVG